MGCPGFPNQTGEEAQPRWAAQGMHHAWGCRPQAGMAGRVGCPTPRCQRLCPPILLIHRPLLLVVVGMGLGDWGAADGARRGMSGERGVENPPRQSAGGRSSHAPHRVSRPSVQALLSQQISLTKHRFKDTSAENFQTQEQSMKTQVQVRWGCRGCALQW